MIPVYGAYGVPAAKRLCIRGPDLMYAFLFQGFTRIQYRRQRTVLLAPLFVGTLPDDVIDGRGANR